MRSCDTKNHDHLQNRYATLVQQYITSGNWGTIDIVGTMDTPGTSDTMDSVYLDTMDTAGTLDFTDTVMTTVIAATTVRIVITSRCSDQVTWRNNLTLLNWGHH